MLSKTDNNQEQVRKKKSGSNKALTVIGIVLCVILVPMLIVNCTLIIKSFINKDEVPDFGGLFPMIVLTDSMNPDIKSGDLIFCLTTPIEDVEEGMVISFFDPAGNGNAVVTHEVIEKIVGDDGTISFRTKGINNNTEDREPVLEENLIGRYTGVRIPYAGKVALFMQSTYGLIVCVFIPFVLIVGYDILRRRKNEKDQNENVAALMAELESLREMQNAECRMQNDEDKNETKSDETKSD
ncbi:MAG: signal peptidase I [Clostridia bacterium]|nr:signal peptidase I [Clostridia bacterium]